MDQSTFTGHRDSPERPMALGHFPARKMNTGHGERLWIKARDLYFNKEMRLRAISDALRINYSTLKGRAVREKWTHYRRLGKVPEEYLSSKKDMMRIRMAAQEANVWQRRKKMDKRRLEVIEKAAQKIMTREERAKEQLDRLVEKTPVLLSAIDDAVKSLEAFKGPSGINPATIGAIKDLVSTHSKLCDTLKKLEDTPAHNVNGIPVESGWIGILGAVRLRDEGRVLRSQALNKARNVTPELSGPDSGVLDAVNMPLPQPVAVPFASG